MKNSNKMRLLVVNFIVEQIRAKNKLILTINPLKVLKSRITPVDFEDLLLDHHLDDLASDFDLYMTQKVTL